MAANTKPIFALRPKIAKCTIATANTARDGSGTIGLLYTAPAGGSKITKIWYKARVTTTAGMVRLFITDNAGNNIDLFEELSVSAITSSATVQSATGYVTYSDFQIEEGQRIYCSTEKAESINVFAMIGDFE